MQADPEIDRALRERYSIEPIRKALARVIGIDHPHLDLLAEIVPAVALHRSALLERPVDPESFTAKMLALISDVAGSETAERR
jgi:hypothetical protein